MSSTGPLFFLLKIVSLPWTEAKRVERRRVLKARIDALDRSLSDLEDVIRRTEPYAITWTDMKVDPHSNFEHVRKFLDLTEIVFGERSDAQNGIVACCRKRMILMKRLYPSALDPVWFNAKRRRIFFLKRMFSFFSAVCVFFIVIFVACRAFTVFI